MKPSQRFSIFLPYFLLCSLAGSSPLPSPAAPLTISSSVGARVVLPCSWKQRLGSEAPPTCHVQWVTLDDTVLEQSGARRFEAEDFRGRVEVPEELLGSGDCSLIIRDVQLADTGCYDSFMVVDGVRSRRTRVFIQTVRLSVQDHKTRVSRPPGGAVTLMLHTQHSVRVVFQNRNSSEWSVLWMRGDPDTPRLEKDPLVEQLILKQLDASDQGTYKVLDEQGLAVSTVQLAVEEESGTSMHQTQEVLPRGVGAKISSSTLLIVFLLVSHLL